MPEFSESDTIVVQVGSRVYTLGDGFSSSEEIETAIEERFDAGTYDYGTLDVLASHTVPEETPDKKTFTSLEEQRLETIKERAANDQRIDSISVSSTKEGTYMCSYRLERVRYEDGEVDFSLRLVDDYFDSLPVSTIDAAVEETIENVFDAVAGDNATYLGYESTYASRGRQNPFVRIYGRVKRESAQEQQLLTLREHPPVEDVYWSEANISAIRVAIEEPTKQNYDANDYIVVLNDTQEITGDLGTVGLEDEERAMEIAEQIEAAYDFRVPWLGLVAYERTHSHVCLGVQYEE